jgi:HPt (histidine-containing phosphotransfer) domain-containing protein
LSEFDERMVALRARFLARAVAETGEIEAYIAAGAWQAVRDISHGLSGRAGMFGFAAIGDAARAVEEAIDAGAAPDSVRALAAALLAQMRGLA